MTGIVTISDLAADAIAALTDTRWSITDAPAHVLARLTAARVIYTSKRRSWTADLRQVATVSLTREGSRGTIRITSASHVEVFSAKWDAASALVSVLRTQQAVGARASS